MSPPPLQYTPALCATPEWVRGMPYGDLVVLNAALLLSIIYIICYPVMELFAGTLGALMVAAIYLETSSLVMQASPGIHGGSLSLP